MERREYEVPVRLSLLEHDQDTLESALKELRNELKAMRTVMVGILISIATASVLLAINIVVQAAGR